ncbi:ataxin-10 [Drosophila rhopaloa]|uniref:Ataxin-10 n=1 Tax=Drosophila rhopaloa TaxID=1041015 RepID=A0A6P4EDA6_DRORH|nr:ataxin-10 [Drosophila rhopaloa]
MEHVTNETSELIQKLVSLNTTENEDEITAILKNLRLLLTKGSENQETLARNVEFSSFLDAVAFNPLMRTEHRIIHNLSLQVLANSVVNNETTQTITWNQHGLKISEQAYASPLGSSNNVLLMIMYNIYLSGRGLISDLVALQTCLRLWQSLNEAQCTYNFEYLHFFLEHFIVQNGRACVASYQKLETEDRVAFLDYVAHYLRENSPNCEVALFLLQHFAKEFRLKSDCLLRETLKLKHELHPREVHTLLRIIASASGSEKYANVYSTDQSLFINVSSLLRCVVSAGKEADGGGLDKPMTKLEEVALTSNIDAGYEKKVSYELKTLLVRCSANLLYDNTANKGYCLDTQLLPTLLECTTMDARNPLMREWSILAIRNACINCPEAQQVIAGLTMQGSAPNDILTELNLDMGALRISDRQK